MCKEKGSLDLLKLWIQEVRSQGYHHSFWLELRKDGVAEVLEGVPFGWKLGVIVWEGGSRIYEPGGRGRGPG